MDLNRYQHIISHSDVDLPLTYVLVTAFGEGIKVFVASVTDYYALKAIGLTLEVTLIAVVVNTIFGIAASWCITRFQFHGKKILSTLIDLPLTISPVIAGLIYILTFGRQSILYEYLRSAGIKMIFAVPGIVVATVFVTFPFISRRSFRCSPRLAPTRRKRLH